MLDVLGFRVSVIIVDVVTISFAISANKAKQVKSTDITEIHVHFLFFYVHVVGCRKAPVAWKSASMSLLVRSGQGQRLLVSSMA